MVKIQSQSCTPTAPLLPEEVEQLKCKLIEAQKKCDYRMVLAINKELRNSMPLSYVARRDRRAKEAQMKTQIKHASKCTGKPRRVYMSLPQLQRRYDAIGLQPKFREELDTALFIFIHSRDAVMKPAPATTLERFNREDRETKFRERFVYVAPELRLLIERKEGERHVFWLGKEFENITELSDWFCKTIDPMTGSYYHPIKIRTSFWKNEFNSSKAKYSRSGTKIVHAVRFGARDWNSLQELLLASNPTLHIVDASARWNWTALQRAKLLATKGRYYAKREAQSSDKLTMNASSIMEK